LEIKGLCRDISGLNEQIHGLTWQNKKMKDLTGRDPLSSSASSILTDKVVLVSRIQILDNIVIRLREQLKKYGGDESIEVDQVLEREHSSALLNDWSGKTIGAWDKYWGSKAEGDATRAEMKDKYGLKSKWTA
jgi:uncharacterized membrane protein